MKASQINPEAGGEVSIEAVPQEALKRDLIGGKEQSLKFKDVMNSEWRSGDRNSQGMQFQHRN